MPFDLISKAVFQENLFSYEREIYENVIVCNGETLWSIASGLDGNVHENIYNIKKSPFVTLY